MKFSVLVVKKLFFITTAFVLLNTVNGFSTDLIQTVFPSNCQQNVTTVPLIHLRSEFPFDTSSIIRTSPYDYSDTTSVSLGNVMLIKKSYHQSVPDSLYSALAVNCTVGLQDQFNLMILPKHDLDYDAEYTLIINSNLKLLVPDEFEQVDTVSNPMEITCFFRTKQMPLYIKDVSTMRISNLGCGEKIEIAFNKTSDLTEWQLNNLIEIVRVGNLIDIDSIQIDYQLDSINFNIELNEDSTSVLIEPLSTELGRHYNLIINNSVLNGGGNEDLIYSPFYYPKETSLKITTKPMHPTDTLPDDLMEINGKGERKLSIGDTTYAIVPLVHGDFYFHQWENLGEGMTPLGNAVKIIGDCDNMKPREIYASYLPIPKDTLQLAPMKMTDNAPHFCSQYVVSGYSDSLNPNTYLYKRFDSKPVMVNVDVCNNFAFDHWESSNEDYDDEENVALAISTDPERLWHEMQDKLNPIKNGLGGFFEADVRTCDKAYFKVNVRFADPTEFASENIRAGVFSKLKVGGTPVTLTGNNYSASGTVEHDYPATEKNLEIELIPAYKMHPLVQTYGWHTGTMWVAGKQYDFDNYLQEWDEPLTKSTTTNDCTMEIDIVITRNPVKFEYEITEKDGQDIPSIANANVLLDPQPGTFLNRPILAEPFTITGDASTWLPVTYTKSDGKYVKSRVTAYYKSGTVLNAKPKINGEVGYVPYEWNEDSPYSEFDVVDEETYEIEYNLNTPGGEKSGNHIMSSEFRLVGIWFDQPLIAENRLSDNNKIKFKIGQANDGLSNYQMWSEFDGDPKLATGIKSLIPEKAWEQNDKEFQTKYGYIEFEFNNNVDISTLINNVKISDANLFKRNDGKRAVKYNLVTESMDEFTANIEDGVLFNKRVALHTGTSPLKVFMCHNNEFYVALRNLSNSTSGYAIKDIDGKQLSNYFSSDENFNDRKKRKTANPGLKVSYARMRTNSDDTFGYGPELVTFTYHNSYTKFDNLAEAVQHAEVNGMTLLNEDGLAVASVGAYQRPPGNGHDGFLTDPPTDDKQIANVEIITRSQILSDEFFQIYQTTYDANYDRIWAALHPLVSKLIEEVLGTVLDETLGESEEAKKVLAYFASLEFMQFDDRFIGTTQMFIGESQIYPRFGAVAGPTTKLHPDFSFDTHDYVFKLQDLDDEQRWANWGTGTGGMYEPKIREAAKTGYELEYGNDGSSSLVIVGVKNWTVVTMYQITLTTP